MAGCDAGRSAGPIPHLAELEIPMRNPRIVALALFVSAVALASASPADAGPTNSAKCQAAKLKAAGKDCGCRHAVAAKALTSGAIPDYTKCTAKLTAAFTKAVRRPHAIAARQAV